MELLNQIFAIIFYILFLCWAFFKTRNVILINKLNCKDIYKNMKKDLKKQKISKYLFRIIITSIIIFAIYLAIGLIAGALALFMMFITLGGAAYVDTGADSTFYDNLMSFVGNHFSLLNYIAYYVYIIVYMLFVKAIYINVLSYKQLNSRDILNNSQQNTNTLQNTINKNES